MQALHESRFSLRDAYRILFRYKMRSALVFVATMTLVILGIIVAPRKYTSEAKLYVKTGRESVALDPTATTGQTVQVHDSRDSEIRSLLDVLQSRVLFEKVVDRLGANTILKDGGTKEGSASLIGTLLGHCKPILVAIGISDKISDREKAILKLEKSVGIESNKKSAVVVLRGKAKSPQMAQNIVVAYVDEYYNLHHLVHRTEGSHEFFATQTELLKKELAKATRDLRDLKNGMGVVSVEGQRAVLEQHMKSLDRELLVTEAALHSSRERILALQGAHPELTAMPDAATASGLTNTAIDEMRDQLYTVQIREREMAAMYTETHPRIVAIHEQVRAAQSLLHEQEFKIERSQAAEWQSKVDNLQEKYTTARQSLLRHNENEVRIRELETKEELLKNNYKTYAKNLELTRMGASLDQQRISNVNLVQPASLVEKPMSPKKLPILALGVVVAILGAFGTALASEYLDHSLKTPEEVEHQLDLPVLLSIPRVSQRELAMN